MRDSFWINKESEWRGQVDGVREGVDARPGYGPDERFSTNSLVIGDPFIRFYAGYPLRGPGGWTVGALCVIDQKPRDFSAKDGRFLRTLAGLVEVEINA